MTRHQRNIEKIRQKNLEDNKRFLKTLHLNNVRDDFIESARSALDKPEKHVHHKAHHEKVERLTRYSLKVQSGEIQPYIPEWQPKGEKKKKKKGRPSKWTLMFKSTENPYKRTFKPRVRH